MWNSDQDYTKEELEVVRELEHDLFLADPGFRAMWHDNFEEYFKGTLDEQYWKKREHEREQELNESERRRMIEDPGYASWRHELAMVEDAAFKSYTDPILARGRKFEDASEDSDYDKPLYRNDPLYFAAKSWSRNISQRAFGLYDKTKALPAFRIARNVPYVASKIVFASGNVHDEEDIDLEWRTDRIGYTLSLSCLNRCLDSLQDTLVSELSEFKFTGTDIRQQLIDRLESIEQIRFKRLLRR